MLVKRLVPPYQGQWFVADVWQGAKETVDQSLRGLVKKEFGIDTDTTGVTVRFVGHFDALYPKCKKHGGQPSWHATWRFHLVHIPQGLTIKLNPEAGEAKWFSEIHPSWTAPVKKALLAAGFAEQSW
jgi:ADP-ribose pyrophosphatase YjhB (NUDIX family)